MSNNSASSYNLDDELKGIVPRDRQNAVSIRSHRSQRNPHLHAVIICVNPGHRQAHYEASIYNEHGLGGDSHLCTVGGSKTPGTYRLSEAACEADYRAQILEAEEPATDSKQTAK